MNKSVFVRCDDKKAEKAYPLSLISVSQNSKTLDFGKQMWYNSNKGV